MIGLVLSLVLGMGQEAVAGAASGEVVFRYAAVVNTLPSYVFRVRADGTGSFVQTVTGVDGLAQETTVALRVSGKTAGALFAGAAMVREGGFQCASKAKGVAKMGMKVLEFSGGSCTWDYATDKSVTGLATTFQGMAVTLDEGQRLAFKQKYDRLGLNDEMTVLWEAVQAGRAVELGNIEGVLEKIAEDGEVMERVRVRAASLMKMGQG